ncbi:MAG: two-component system cell cycle response regulator [Marinobacter psychrophilus]|jgi:two-component system cell cycle response regulator
MKTVIIEPSRLYRRLITNVLTSFQLEVSAYDHGQEALDHISTERPDVICISMHLPDMSGIDVCQQIREMGEVYKNVPILMITSKDNPATLEKALIAGATDILQKDEVDNIEMRLQTLLPNRLLKRHSGDVLYLEDSRTAANIARAQLQSVGLTMDHAETVQEALNYIEKKPYDLLITDIVLKEALTGLDFIKEIRSRSDLDHTPILAITAVDDVTRRVAILNAGCNDYLIKPIIESEFFARINNLLSLKELFDQLTRERLRLIELATKDSLTTLYNRHFLLETAQRKFAEAYRHKFKISLMVLDVDYFKRINDEFGHDGGDFVLKAIAVVLKKYFREEDIVARIGGEEFVIMLCHSDEKNTFDRAEKLRKNIEILKPLAKKITVSIGVATLGITTVKSDIAKETFDDLFTRADKALYESKHAGRNCVTQA